METPSDPKENCLSHAPKKLAIVAVIVAVLLLATPLYAEEDIPAPSAPLAPATVTRILGDQAMVFSLGTVIPLFFLKFDTGAVEATNLTVGAKGSIQYLTYLSPSFTLGFELMGGFAFTPNFNIYWTLPITAQISYIIPIGTWSIFLNLGLGVDFQSFIGYSHMDPFVRPQVAVYMPLDPSLELGLVAGYWLIPQFALQDQEKNKPGQSRLGNFLDISLSLIYHF
jgi:hypothetical protein